LLVDTNQWDRAALAAFRASDAVTSIPGAIDDIATTEQLERVAEVIPAEWLAPAATGTPDQCVDVINRQLELGATGVILHGATPNELEPIVDAYRARRKPEQFAHLSANPARWVATSQRAWRNSLRACSAWVSALRSWSTPAWVCRRGTYC